MPVTNNSITIGTTATVVSGPSINAKIVYVQDGEYDNQSQVWVGSADVTTANSVKLSKVNVTVFQLNADDTLYAIGDSESSSVRVTEVS